MGVVYRNGTLRIYQQFEAISERACCLFRGPSKVSEGSVNTPIQEKLAQLEDRVNRLEKLRWKSKEAEQLKEELLQAEIDLMRAYPDLEQATKQAE